MSLLSEYSPIPSQFGRVAIVAALGAACLVAPLSAIAQPVKTAYHHTGMTSADMRQETIDQRISNLHRALKITPSEETNWNGVAQVMRDNNTAMHSLMAERAAQPAGSVNAVDDLKTYERFNRAHVEGLKNLISSFETLYNTMPADQKALADHVFQNFGHNGHRVNS
jgi:periplasmic protein CpxP/Spy